MVMKLLSADYTNEMLLQILPFSTGYLLREDGNPDEHSVMLAMMLQGAKHASSPHKLFDPRENLPQ